MVRGRKAAVLLSGALCLGATVPANAELPCTAWLTWTFFKEATPAHVSRCLDAGADPAAPTADGRSPRDLARDNPQLEGTAVYRRLEESGEE